MLSLILLPSKHVNSIHQMLLLLTESLDLRLLCAYLDWYSVDSTTDCKDVEEGKSHCTKQNSMNYGLNKFIHSTLNLVVHMLYICIVCVLLWAQFLLITCFFCLSCRCANWF